MADISKININGAAYNIKDSSAASANHNHNYLSLTDTFLPTVGGGILKQTSENVTGYLIITLPTIKSCTMLSFQVDVYNYSTNTTVTYFISGYPYDNASWYNPTVYSLGSAGYRTNLTVRYGHNGTNSQVSIGESNTTWSYPQVVVHNVSLGHNNVNNSTWASGWSVAFSTTPISNVSQEITPCLNAQKLTTSSGVELY